MDSVEIIFSVFLGIGLAAASGFRVFLPLLVLSLAGHYNYIPLNESLTWVGSLAAVVTLGVATLVEIFGYYIPWFDNLLDSISLPLAALAGTTIILATVGDMNPIVTWVLAIIAGGGTAVAIKGNASALRLRSNATTGELASPIISTVKTAASMVMSLLSILIAPMGFIIVLVLFFGIYRFYKNLRKNRSPSI